MTPFPEGHPAPRVRRSSRTSTASRDARSMMWCEMLLLNARVGLETFHLRNLRCHEFLGNSFLGSSLLDGLSSSQFLGSTSCVSDLDVSDLRGGTASLLVCPFFLLQWDMVSMSGCWPLLALLELASVLCPFKMGCSDVQNDVESKKTIFLKFLGSLFWGILSKLCPGRSSVPLEPPQLASCHSRSYTGRIELLPLHQGMHLAPMNKSQIIVN